MLNRRKVLLAGASLLPLAACGGLTQGVSSLPQYAQDAQDIAAALENVVGAVQAVPGVPAGTLAQVQAAIARASAIAAQIGQQAAGLAGSTPTSLLGSFGQTILGVVSSLGGASATGTLGTVLQAVMSVLPSILAIAGVALAPPVGGMAPAQGRQIIKAYARR